MTKLGLTAVCDNSLKFDCYCQISGSGSSSLNSCKLPGCFSYGLGTRLVISLKTVFSLSQLWIILLIVLLVILIVLIGKTNRQLVLQ